MTDTATAHSPFPRTVEALRAEGVASAAVAIAIAEEFPRNEKGQLDREAYVADMQPALADLGFDVSYNTARVAVRAVTVYGGPDGFQAVVDTVGFTQAREAAKASGRGTLAQQKRRAMNLLKAATNAANKRKPGSVPTVADVARAAKGSPDPKAKAVRKATVPKAPTYTRAELRTASTEDLMAYMKGLTEQHALAKLVLGARADKAKAA